jgi:KipI family sensor histidine kinase inhibitor
LLVVCDSNPARAARALLRLPGLVNLHPAYESILVDFDPLRTDAAVIERAICESLLAAAGDAEPPPRLVEIPVHYDGCDLEDVARLTGLAPWEVVRRHSSAEYSVRFLGFSPGFPYLSGLPPDLAVPRLTAPRKRVPAGSVAIGGAQTGVYPVASPGGWRIIGRTSLALFDPGMDPPALLAMGDRVRFVEVGG